MRIATEWVIVAGMGARAGVGVVAVLAAGIAAAAGYLGDWFSGLGLPFGGGPAATTTASKDVAKDEVKADGGRTRVVVQGEQCMLAGDATPRACDAVCKEVPASASGATSAADVDATVGSQATVDALRACLQGRGVKVQVLSE